MSAPKVIHDTVNKPEVFSVFNGYEWGTVYIRPCRMVDGVYEGVEVVANTGLGTYGYCWTSIGRRGWQSFLTGLDMDYAMQKFMGSGWRVDVEGDDLIEALIVDVNDRRDPEFDDAQTTADYDSMLEVLKEMKDECRDREDQVGIVEEWSSRSNGLPYKYEMYMDLPKKDNPQGQAFWERIWVPLMESVKVAA